MSDQWTDRLSEYLDGELEQSERAALEAHLASCSECATILTELRRVVARAQALEDRPPARELWPGIADRIGASTDLLAVRRARRRVSFTMPQLIAASVALMAVSAGVAHLATRRTPAAVTSAIPAPQPSFAPVLWPDKVDSLSDRAVAELRLALADGQRTGRLSSTTAHRLEHSLAVIDTAIAEGKRALVLDPKSAYLNQHLADTMRRKMELLREANRIASART